MLLRARVCVVVCVSSHRYVDLVDYADLEARLKTVDAAGVLYYSTTVDLHRFKTKPWWSLIARELRKMGHTKEKLGMYFVEVSELTATSYPHTLSPSLSTQLVFCESRSFTRKGPKEGFE